MPKVERTDSAAGGPNDRGLLPVPIAERAIAIPPAKGLLIRLVSGSLLGGGLLDVVRQNPEALPKILATAYYFPDLVSREEAARPTLEYLRRTYPAIIASLDNKKMEKVLSRFPTIQRRVTEDQEVIRILPEQHDVRTIELALRILIGDGNVRIVESDTYYRIVASHELYRVLVAETLENKSIAWKIGRAEEEAVIKIGQRLLRARRLFEVDIERVDDNYNKHHKSRETEFQGELSRLLVWGRIIGALEETGDLDRASRYRQDFRIFASALSDRFSERQKELSAIIQVVDHGHRSRWTEVLGGPDLTRAELTSFMHSGND